MTAKTRLKTLTLNCFRGASQPVTIPFSTTPITLLFGENGTGKSSIIDGLEFVLEGRPGSIEEISGATPSSHLPTMHKSSKDIQAAVELRDGTIFRAQMEGRNIAVVSEGTSPRPNTAILRRSKILSVVSAKPGERYEALASFIDVSGVEACENALGKAINDQKSKHTAEAGRVQQAEDELQRLFNEHATDDEKDLQFEGWAKKYKDQDISKLKSDVELLGNASQAYITANNALSEADNQKGLWEEKHAEQTKAEEAFRKEVKTNPEAISLLIDLLESGKAYLEKIDKPLEKCPLCNSPATLESIHGHIEKQLSEIPGVKEAKRKMEDAAAQAKQQKTNAFSAYFRTITSAAALFKAAEKLPDEFRKNIVIPPEYSQLGGLPKEFKPVDVTKELMDLARRFVNVVMPHATHWKEEHDKIEPRKVLLTSIQTHYASLVKGRKEAKKIEKIRDRLNAMLEVIRPLRQGYVQSTLASVATDCDTLYSEIHKDEPLGKVHLMLDPKKRSSCDIRAQFYGKTDVPPQAYYSESHMDTLGFVLFLALAKRQGIQNTVIILDDVFTSVDDQHLGRVFDLLAKEVSSIGQMIIATHSRKVLNWVKVGRLPQNIFGPIELSSRWTLQDGIRVFQSTLYHEEIKSLLNQPNLDRNNLAARSRRHLEALTRDLAFKLGATGPLKKNGDYELSDYLGGLSTKISKQKWRVRDTNPSPKPVLREDYDFAGGLKTLNSSKIILNQLVHDTDEDASFTDDELRQFSQDVLILDEYLRCPECGSLVGSNKDIKSCACGKRVLQQVP